MAIVIDVVIPAYHPDERLLRIVELLSRQTRPVRRIRVIDTGDVGLRHLLEITGQNVETFATQYPALEITRIEPGTFDHGGTRNLGLERSKDSTFVVYMTQDALPAGENLIERLTDPLIADETLAASYARQLAYPNATVEERCSREFNYPAQSRVKAESDFDSLGIKTYFCSNVCAAYRTQTLVGLGGFPGRAIFNEDMIYAGTALKAGYRIRYSAEAQVYHSHQYGASAQFHRNYDLGVSQAEHPEIFAAASSEGEGVTYVKAVMARMVQAGKWYQIPGFCWRCGWRLIGYRLGKGYERQPQWFRMRCASNKGYFMQR